MTLLRLFWEFFKTGLFAVGGGMATVPFLKEMSLSTGWFSLEELADMIAVSESTPGPIGVNMATYVGFVTGSNQLSFFGSGFVGAVVATLGLITPSVIIILFISAFLQSFRDNRWVTAAFEGLRPASSGLIGAALVGVLMVIFPVAAMNGIGDFFISYWPQLLLLAVLLYFTRSCKKTKDLHPIFFILASAVCGILLQL